ncbi:MAG: GNAT family N-acetyltransferase [Candidatus Methylacidiphilales bacterium]
MLPVLYTSRLILRPFTLEDCEDVQRLAGHEEVARMTANIPHPYPPDAAKAWIEIHEPAYAKGLLASFAVTKKDDQKLMGCVAIGLNQVDMRGELAYWMGVPYWNQGFTTEARECVRFCFEQFNLAKVSGAFFSINAASGRVMQKLGMVQEGYRRRHMMKNGVLTDLVEYAVLREDFRSSAKL